MAQKGVKGIRAAWADAVGQLARAEDRKDPAPTEKREGYEPGAWPGAPSDKLPPNCPVTPLGMDGKTAYFIDTVGQLIDVTTSEWGKKILLQLFCAQPNYVPWAWPRWSAPKKGRTPAINGVEVDEACAALLKAASERGLFDTVDRVRGRGAWTDRHGRLIWHSGELLWTVDPGAKSKLRYSPPGEIDGIFYPRRPSILEPWQEPVDPSDSPARHVFELLRSWTWERPVLDPVIALGGIAAMIIGGALPWRPHVAAMGDKGTGKSELNNLIKGIVADALHDTGNTSAAGIYQRVKLDTLPVAVDEFEASEDNRRVVGIVELMRIASSGARMFRGGQDHQGVEFLVRSSFFASGINLPPMKPQDRSRFAVLNLDKLDVGDKPAPVVEATTGRMFLRALMDAWPDFPRVYGDWRAVLRGSGLDGRAQDTYGTLFSLAEMLLGAETLEEIGLPITEAQKLGGMIAQATAAERADQLDNWRACLEHLLGATIDAWKGGEKPTPGALIEQVETNKIELPYARERFAAAGLGLIEEADAVAPHGSRRYCLAVPHASPALARLFQGTRWSDGGWAGALKQGASAGVIRRERKVVKINRVPVSCLVVDLKAYDRMMEGL